MTITTKTMTNVDVTKQDKDFLKAYYKEVLEMAFEDLEDDDFEEIFPSGFEGGKPAYGFCSSCLLNHLDEWFFSKIYEGLFNYEDFEIEWEEKGKNKCLNLMSLFDDEDFENMDGNLYDFVQNCYRLSKDEGVYNEILLPLIKEQVELLMKKSGITLVFDYTDDLKYSYWK